jgi:glycine cleavage system H protein
MTGKVLQDRKYTKEHEWVSIDGDYYTMGITEFAQGALGEIIFAELPAVGKSVQQGKALGVVESIKSVSDVYAPLSGEIVEANDELATHPEQFNSDCWSAWMVKVKIVDQKEIGNLLDPAQYQTLCDQAS